MRTFCMRDLQRRPARFRFFFRHAPFITLLEPALPLFDRRVSRI